MPEGNTDKRKERAMSDTRFEMMKEAYELVKKYHDTYKLFKKLGNAESENDTFCEYNGARGLFEKLFGIDYYDARSIFEHFEVPF